jgi:hypothetical protein
MMPAHKFQEIEYHPYDVHVVPVEQINHNDYYTISKTGVQHVVNGIAEFTALDDWEEEYRVFCMVAKFRFFSQFRMWKQYVNPLPPSKIEALVGKIDQIHDFNAEGTLT